MATVTTQDKAFIAAVAGLDERRANDRSALLKAYRSVYAVGEDVTDRQIMTQYHRLMKVDAARDYAETIEAVKTGATRAAAAEGAGKLVTLAMQEQEDMRQSRANAARLVRNLTERLADNPDDKRVTLAGLSKLLQPIFGYELGDDEGLDAETARALTETIGEAQPQPDVAALSLPSPARRGSAPAGPVFPGNGGVA